MRDIKLVIFTLRAIVILGNVAARTVQSNRTAGWYAGQIRSLSQPGGVSRVIHTRVCLFGSLPPMEGHKKNGGEFKLGKARS